MANTWNRSGTTWSQGLWGEQDSNTITLTGVSSSTSIGTVASFAEQGWGRDDWGKEPWGESFDPVVSVTGFGLTVSLGTTEESNQTGWGRLSWGTADWGEGRDETVSVSGLEATSTLGNITTENKILLEMIGSNHSMTSSVGSPQVDGEIGVPLTGVSAEFATPTLSYAGTLVGWGRDAWGDNSWGESPNQVITLVGREATTSVGSPTLEFAYELSGQEATTSVGSVSFVISPIVSLTGQSSTTSVGTPGLAFGASTEPISGVASTSAVGTLGLEFGPSQITGVSATFSVGEVEVGSVELIDAVGVSATSAVGSIIPEIGVPLTGVSSTSSVGSITPDDVVQGLTTSEILSSVGLLGIESYANIDTGSNTSYTSVATGSNSSYSSVATGSNTSYTDAA